MPGVSTSTNCAASVVTIARRRLRVVCATGEVIATFSPTIRFTKVDLPTLGRPMSATNPERKSSGVARVMRSGCRG